jgi:hypothetical protein
VKIQRNEQIQYCYLRKILFQAQHLPLLIVESPSQLFNPFCLLALKSRKECCPLFSFHYKFPFFFWIQTSLPLLTPFSPPHLPHPPKSSHFGNNGSKSSESPKVHPFSFGLQ